MRSVRGTNSTHRWSVPTTKERIVVIFKRYWVFCVVGLVLTTQFYFFSRYKNKFETSEELDDLTRDSKLSRLKSTDSIQILQNTLNNNSPPSIQQSTSTSSSVVKVIPNEDNFNNRTFLVLYWVPVSSFMGKHMLGPPPGKCPVNCTYTEQVSTQNEADAVVFHIPGFHSGFPASKPPNQKWVAYSMESEEYYTKLKDEDFMANFDWTMTYKLDSDIICGYWSGNLTNFLRPPLSKDANATAAFIASNCGATNNRTGYVKELMKYTSVHSFGRCIHNMDFPPPEKGVGGSMQKVNMISHYKFTLAFENHNAKDYVTEKFFHTLYSGSVPVYMGSPNIHQFAPSPNSYIMANNLSPKELGDLLNRLDKNDSEYQKYLSWKTEGPTQQFIDFVSVAKYDARCRLCMKLANMKLPTVKQT